MPKSPCRHVAVLDVGKTNAKLVLFDLQAGREIAARRMPNEMRGDGFYPHADVERIFEFALQSLAEFRRFAPIDALSFTTHGAAAALLSGEGLALPVLDYEFDGPDETAADYDRLRPDFAETFSPRMGHGLNLGAQLFWQEKRFPAAFAKTDRIVTYPQYWAWRFSGVVATEVSSLAAHSDLWNPKGRCLSSLALQQGWDRLLAPMRSAFDVLGLLRPDLVRHLGLAADLPVHCGIHDSNASLLPHLLNREPPFALVSSGTWIVVFGVGGRLEGLDVGRDTLANIDAFGRPVPSALFMGGREFDLLTGGAASDVGDEALRRVLQREIMVLPAVIPGSGPFPQGQGGWADNRRPEYPAETTAAATLYLALMTETCLGLVDAAGPTVVEGPIAKNRLYCAALSSLTRRAVIPNHDGTGTSGGAALLACGTPVAGAVGDSVAAGVLPAFPDEAALRRYAEKWRRLAGGR